MPQVMSTAIREFEYRPDRNELYVQFTTGRKYVYLDVPAAVYRGFCNAGSFGEYFNCYIRDHYDFRALPS
jgi:hypothetical protein